jgi:hypothetical protein
MTTIVRRESRHFLRTAFVLSSGSALTEAALLPKRKLVVFNDLVIEEGAAMASFT